ncbi:hypothetical protein WJX72_010341 [[Myrmecia] bisecta]|uniref:Uncharacterized protein n=1 Tax=[Myrmecia] bisecta TaxID=41462 RepID=A0AAW1PH68_9CHLO
MFGTLPCTRYRVAMVSGTVAGALFGLGVQLYSNALRKVPLMRNPWEHVIAIGVGAGFGTWLVDFEERTTLDVERMLQKRAEANKKIPDSG